MTALLRLLDVANRATGAVLDLALRPVLEPLWARLTAAVVAPDHFDVFADDDAPTAALDARGIPTAACPACGCGLLTVTAAFDPETYELDHYALDGSCADCGALLTIPTPLDHPTYVPEA